MILIKTITIMKCLRTVECTISYKENLNKFDET